MKLRITVEGRTYEVDVEVLAEGAPAKSSGSPSAVAPAIAPTTGGDGRSPAASPQHAGQSASRACVAPLPGTVVRIAVSAGDEVALNQTLLVLDAMKMETNVPSPVAGRVRAVAVPPGARVQQGDVLVEFE